MSAKEMMDYLALDGAADALQVRRIDDLAKVSGLAVPPASNYRKLLIGLAETQR